MNDGSCGYTWYTYRGATKCEQLVRDHGPRHTHGLAWVAVGAETLLPNSFFQPMLQQ